MSDNSAGPETVPTVARFWRSEAAEMPAEPSPAEMSKAEVDAAAELEAALLSNLDAVSSFWNSEGPEIEEPAAKVPAVPVKLPKIEDHEDLTVALRLAQSRNRDTGTAAAARPAAAEAPAAIEPPRTSKIVWDDGAADGSDVYDEAFETEAQAIASGGAAYPRLNRALFGIVVVLAVVGATGAFLTMKTVTDGKPVAVASADAQVAKPAAPVAKEADRVAADGEQAPAPAEETAPMPVKTAAIELPAESDDQVAAAFKASETDAPAAMASDKAADTAPETTASIPARANTATARTTTTAPVRLPGTAQDSAGQDSAVSAFAPPDPQPRAFAAVNSAARPADTGSDATDSADAAPPAKAKAKATASRGGGLQPGPARIVTAVKMRAGSHNNAAVVTTLAAGTPIEIVACHGWCEIKADGKHGYVFKRFIKADNTVAER